MEAQLPVRIIQLKLELDSQKAQKQSLYHYSGTKRSKFILEIMFTG